MQNQGRGMFQLPENASEDRPQTEFRGLAGRLENLTNDLQRVARSLRQVSSSVDQTAPATDAKSIELWSLVKLIMHMRHLRARYVAEDLFADPAWDILLDLKEAEFSGRRVAISSACIAAAVPATTALRWINTLTKRRLIIRENDPHDQRRVFVRLAPTTSQAIDEFLSASLAVSNLQAAAFEAGSMPSVFA